MARLYSSVRLHLFSQPTPGKVLSALNAEIHAQGMGHRFVTFVLLTLDPVRHEMTIANAGHLPPIVRTADGKSTSVGRKESGMPLGINPEQEYGEITLALEPGTSVVVYTDGITEAMNAANDLFGRVRLENFVSSISGSSEDLTKAIVTEVDRFCGTRPAARRYVPRLPAAIRRTGSEGRLHVSVDSDRRGLETAQSLTGECRRNVQMT